MSLLEVFASWVEKQPQKVLYSYLNDNGAVVKSFTYSELNESSDRLAAHLRQNNLHYGDRVLLVYPPSLDFVVSFYACLKAGLIAVPVFPPDPSRLNKDLPMFSAIARACSAVAALTSAEYNFATKVKSVVGLTYGEWPKGLNWIVTDKFMTLTAAQPAADTATPHPIAFLQFTSGSTSEPKGVVISQSNLAHNLNLIITGLSASDDTIVVSWLPQYHDMGLIGSYLGAMYCGGCGYYMSPLSFIRNPTQWIRAISTYRGTHMQAPNFAYQLCARKFLLASRNASSQSWVTKLDLSCVRHMINAAEPVDAQSIDTFYAVFKPFRLPNNVVFPTYGLAEHTVFVCTNGAARLRVSKTVLEKQNLVQTLPSGDDTDAITLVGCGKPLESVGVRLCIVSPDTRVLLDEGRVGEVWLQSSSVADGYWAQEEKTEEDFRAKIADRESDGGFLRTGDLGFMHQGELYICGRAKDLIIIRGRNHYPQDIERTCESFAPSLLRGGCSAAFSVQVGRSEELVYVAELSDDVPFDKKTDSKYKTADSFIQDLARQISTTHGVTAHVVCLISPRSIPKTTSGKIARNWVRKAYFADELQVQYSWNSMYADTTDDYFEDASGGAASSGGRSLLADEAEESSSLSYDEDRIDPTGMHFDLVADKVKDAVAAIVCKPADSLDLKTPLTALGMDSMRGIELQSSLEKKFSVQLPDALMFEPDATLTTLTTALILGGRMKGRPILVNGWEVVQAARLQVSGRNAGKVPPSGALPPQWFREHATKADVDSYKFPDNCAKALAPLHPLEDVLYMGLSLWLFGMFILMPVLIVIAFAYFPASKVVGILALFLSGIYLFPADRWPPSFRRDKLFEIACRYFSYRIIMEQPDFENRSPNTPSIYAMGPHGVFCIGHSIQTLLNEFVLGKSFHHLAASAALWMPMYNITLKLMGYKSVDAKTFRSLLNNGRSVGLVPGGIAEMFTAGDIDEKLVVLKRKGFIKISLETGSQIVPCYCFGNSQTFASISSDNLKSLSRLLRVSLIWFWGRYGLPVPFRAPLLTVIGRPIQCPLVTDPSAELINEYHALYLKETMRIYNAYRNAYGWGDKELRFTS